MVSTGKLGLALQTLVLLESEIPYNLYLFIQSSAIARKFLPDRLDAKPSSLSTIRRRKTFVGALTMGTVIPIERLSTELLELDRASTDTGADLRQQAQEVLAEPSIALPVREAIADSLSQANQLLTLKTVGREDSY
jgi:hypothetical protein